MRWLTQKEVDAKWTEEELEVHLASGRLIYREAGHNVCEFQDTQDIEKTVAGKRPLQYQFGQVYELEEGGCGRVVQNVGKGFAQHFAGGLEKGKGSAKGSGLEKGKGKGKARAKPKPQPLEDC